MWKGELFSVLVQTVLLYFAVDVYLRVNYSSDERCHDVAKSSRSVLVLSSFNLMNATAATKSKMDIGVYGQTYADPEDCKGLSALFHGFTKGPLDFLYYRKEEKIFDINKNESFTIIETDIDKLNIENSTLYVIISNKSKNCARDYLIWGPGIKHASHDIKQADLNALIVSNLGLKFLKKSIGVPPNYTRCSLLHMKSLAKLYYRQIQLIYSLFINDESIEKMNMNEYIFIINTSRGFNQNIVLYLGFVTYLGWLFLLSIYYFKLYLKSAKKYEKENSTAKFNTYFIILCFASLMYVMAHDLPTRTILYFILPLIIWRLIFDRVRILKALGDLKNSEYVTSLSGFVLVVTLSEFIFWSIRSRFLIFTGFFFVMMFYTIRGAVIHWDLTLLSVSSVSGILFIILTFVPKIPHGSFVLLNIGGAFWFLGGVACSFFMLKKYRDFITMSFCLLHFLTTLVLTNMVIKKIIKCCFLWILGLLGSLIPLTGGDDNLNRIKQLVIVTVAPFLLFSIDYEALSLFCLVALYISWFVYDKKNIQGNFPKKTDLYYSFFFVILLFTSFQSIGYSEDFINVDLTYIERFGEIICPYMIGFLVYLKTSIVIVTLSIVFHGIHDGNTAHSLLAVIILNLIGFRFYLDICFNLNYEKPERQLLRYGVTQLTIITLITFSCFIKVVLSTRIDQIIKLLKEKFRRVPVKEEFPSFESESNI